MYPAMTVLITAVVVFWASIMLDAVLMDEEFGDMEPVSYYALLPWHTLRRFWNLLGK